MKKIKLAVCLVSMLGVLGACGVKESPESPERAEAPLRITFGKQADENYTQYVAGQDINNNPMIQLGIDKLGIEVNYTIIGNDPDDYLNKTRLALNRTKMLPDVIPVYDRNLIAELIDSGQVKAIEDDLANLMSERLQEVYGKNPDTFETVEKDGHLYGLAIAPSLAETQVLVIRQDWLDNLNLQAPTTIAEFETVIQAFTEEDPDGNGKQDTYGFSYSGDGTYSSGWLGDVAMVFSVYTGKFIPGNWEYDEDNQLSYGSIHAGNRQALAMMAAWHKKGWIQPDAAVTNDWEALMEFRNGRSGIYIGRPNSLEISSEIKRDTPTAAIKAYPTIRQKNGGPTYQRAEENDGWFLFNRNFDEMAAFFDYYDWLYDLAFGTGDFQYGYLEDYDYQLVGETPQFGDVQADATKSLYSFQTNKSIPTKNRPYLDQMKPYYDVFHGKTPESGLELQIAAQMSTLPERVEGTALAYEHRDELVANKFLGHLSADLFDQFQSLQILEQEIYTKIIYGELPLTAFDEFVEHWWQNGGTEITAAVNRWVETNEPQGGGDAHARND